MSDFLDNLEQQLIAATTRGAPAPRHSPAMATGAAGAPFAAPPASSAARRSARTRAPRRPARRRLTVLVCAVIVLAAGGLALGGVIQFGSKAKPEPSARQFGPLLPGSARVEPISSPDPAGGLPWGMSVYSTKLGVGCLQVGRLLDGRLGALGADGAFADDGRFHELPPQTAAPFFSCAALDGNGRVFTNVTFDNVPASAWNGFGACVPQTATPAEKAPERGHATSVCPESAERDLHFGLLGPEVESVTYTSAGAAHTQMTSGPDGAYLIVERASPKQLLAGKGLGASNIIPVDGPITEIHYRDGQTCRLTSKSWMGGANSCSPALAMPLGYKPVKTPTAGEVLAPVSARVGRGPRGEREILVSFVSPVAVTEYRSSYSVALAESSIKPRAYAATSSPTATEAKAGATVTIPLRATSGRSLHAGTYSGTVRLLEATKSQLFEGPGTEFLKVGSFSVHVR